MQAQSHVMVRAILRHLRTDFSFAAETSFPASEATYTSCRQVAEYYDARTSQHTVLLRGDWPQPGNPAQHRDTQSRHVPTRQSADALRILRPSAFLAADRIPSPGQSPSASLCARRAPRWRKSRGNPLSLLASFWRLTNWSTRGDTISRSSSGMFRDIALDISCRLGI